MAVCMNANAPHQRHGKEDRCQRPHRAAGWETGKPSRHLAALHRIACDMQEATERMAQLEAEAARHEFATECEGFAEACI